MPATPLHMSVVFGAQRPLVSYVASSMVTCASLTPSEKVTNKNASAAKQGTSSCGGSSSETNS